MPSMRTKTPTGNLKISKPLVYVILYYIIFSKN